MTIPKEIVEKMEQVNSLMLEIDKWLDENIDTDGSRHCHKEYMSDVFNHEDYYQFIDKPTGTAQYDGEYCEQHQCGMSEDCYCGIYYYPTENGNYFYFYFEV